MTTWTVDLKASHFSHLVLVLRRVARFPLGMVAAIGIGSRIVGIADLRSNYI